jgi:uncharacterized membrane protein
MANAKQHRPSSWLRHTRNLFLTGILVAIPLVVTYFVFKWLFDALDGIFQPIIIFFIGHSLPGVGLVALAILVYLLGLATTNLIGRRLIRWLDAIMCRVPVIQYVYTAAKQAVDAVGRLRQVPFKKVVIVEFPKVGMYSVAFITGKAIDFRGQKKIPVFVPHTPNPMTGFLVLLPVEDIINTDMTIEDAMRMVLSGGLLSPETITEPPKG